jgi:hypothetical protein
MMGLLGRIKLTRYSVEWKPAGEGRGGEKRSVSEVNNSAQKCSSDRPTGDRRGANRTSWSSKQ